MKMKSSCCIPALLLIALLPGLALADTREGYENSITRQQIERMDERARDNAPSGTNAPSPVDTGNNLENWRQGVIEEARQRREQEAQERRAREARQHRTLQQILEDAAAERREAEERDERKRNELLRELERGEQGYELHRKFQREHLEYKAQERVRARNDALARLTALQAEIPAGSGMTPIQYLRAMDAALPEYDLLLPLAEAAYEAYPRELAFASGLALTMGCLPDEEPQPHVCTVSRVPEGIARMRETLDGGPLVDRMRFCTLAYAQDKPDATLLDRCLAATPEIPKRVRKTFWRAVHDEVAGKLVGVYTLSVGSYEQERWNLLMHPGWQKLSDTGFRDFGIFIKMREDVSVTCNWENKDQRCDSRGGVGWIEAAWRDFGQKK